MIIHTLCTSFLLRVRINIWLTIIIITTLIFIICDIRAATIEYYTY